MPIENLVVGCLHRVRREAQFNKWLYAPREQVIIARATSAGTVSVISARVGDRVVSGQPLATLRTDAPLFSNVDDIRWRGPTDAFAAFVERMGNTKLIDRCTKARALAV